MKSSSICFCLVQATSALIYDIVNSLSLCVDVLLCYHISFHNTKN